MNRTIPTTAEKGSALISTLLVIVVLAIIVTAFLQSMALERMTARSYLNRYRAELAAKAGLSEVLGKLETATSDSNYHYSVSTQKPGEDDERLQVATKTSALSRTVETTDLVSMGGSLGDTRIKVVPATSGASEIQRTAAWSPLYLENDTTTPVARFAFWTDEANSKQDAAQHLGEADRKRLESLDELTLLTRNGTEFTKEQKEAVKNEQNAPAADNLLLTPRTLNEVATDLSPSADDYDFTLDSESAFLNPEGKPRLNLDKLKEYVDGLPLIQGSTSPRFQLIDQLLNISGDYGAEKDNPWGKGNLEVVTRIFPKKIDGEPIQARQFVANLLDYIDADMIPTTDGQPGTIPTGISISAAHPTQSDPVITDFPPPPTVMGIEAKVAEKDSDGPEGVKGHPFITYVGQGFIFNRSGKQINSTRILGWVGMAYPWERQIPIGKRIGARVLWRYHVEMQVKLDGTANMGTRGSVIQSDTTATGYFLHGWLGQECNYSGAFDFNKILPHSYFLFPRAFSGGLDLANGWYTINQPDSITFSSFQSTIEVLRLIYTGEDQQRYLVQDLSVLKSAPRTYEPSTYSIPSSTVVKLGSSYTYRDWHYLSDPSLNFQTDGWTQAATTKPSSPTDYGQNGVTPAGSTDVYSTVANERKDALQEMTSNSDTWFKNPENHFPTMLAKDRGSHDENGIDYRPSPDAGESAMLSYAEFGFIHAGAPWETLALYNDPSRFSAPYDNADWRLLDYVDINRLPKTMNALSPQQPEIPGQFNVNTGKTASLQALFRKIPNLSETEQDQLASVLKDSSERPFLDASDIVSEKQFTNKKNFDFEREDLIGRVYPALTQKSQRFTVYSVGEALDRKKRPISRTTLVADVELIPDKTGKKIVPRVVRTTFQ